MDIIIMDQEMESANRMIASNMQEAAELGKRLNEVLTGLAQKGFADRLISEALCEKASEIAGIMCEVQKAAQGTALETEEFIEAVDREDRNLY